MYGISLFYLFVDASYWMLSQSNVFMMARSLKLATATIRLNE